MKRWLELMVCLSLQSCDGSPSSAADAPAVVVGRVYAVEGDLLRYVPAERTGWRWSGTHLSVQRMHSFR